MTTKKKIQNLYSITTCLQQEHQHEIAVNPEITVNDFT
jgi:hypothetical protein